MVCAVFMQHLGVSLTRSVSTLGCEYSSSSNDIWYGGGGFPGLALYLVWDVGSDGMVTA